MPTPDPPYRVTVPYAPRRALAVHYDAAAHSRVTHKDASEEALDATWAARLAAAPGLFNGSKFRLADVTLAPTVATLRLGLTDYRAYLGTHAQSLQTLLPVQCRARPLGNVVVATTTDGLVPLIRRAARVADAPGQVALPGGHAEPDAVDWPEPTGDEAKAEAKARPESQARSRLTNAAVLAEVVDGARREVLEELFVPSADVAACEDFELLGVIERLPDGKPTVAFGARLHVSAARVRALYDAGNVECDESDALLFVDADKLVAFAGPVEQHPVRGAAAELVGAAELVRQQRAAEEQGGVVPRSSET